MIVPGYSYPSKGSTYWDTLQKSSDVVAYAILNHNNGEFTSPDANYTRLFKENTQKGLKNIAYVHLSYGERSVDDVLKDVDHTRGPRRPLILIGGGIRASFFMN